MYSILKSHRKRNYSLKWLFLEVKFRLEKQEITHQIWCIILFYAIMDLEK